jgi:hypothetical protein
MGHCLLIVFLIAAQVTVDGPDRVGGDSLHNRVDLHASQRVIDIRHDTDGRGDPEDDGDGDRRAWFAAICVDSSTPSWRFGDFDGGYLTVSDVRSHSMVHPIDIPSRREHDPYSYDREQRTKSGGATLLALVIVAIFVVAVVFTIASGDGTQQAPAQQQSESPAVPGE